MSAPAVDRYAFRTCRESPVPVPSCRILQSQDAFRFGCLKLNRAPERAHGYGEIPIAKGELFLS